MENLENKLAILSHIAKELNQENITWAVGASMLLYFKGITSEFHDIDIMVAEDDVEIVKDVLLSFGSIQTPNPNIKYKTKFFLEFIVDGIDIDVMAGLIIINNDKEFYFPLKKENINDYTEVNEIKIPLQSLEEWRYYYELMGRDEKVKMIDAMNSDRNWTVLFIGGASGTGKSSIAYEIARFYGVNVLEVDDIFLSVETVTTKEDYPLIHYWNSGVNWRDVGVDCNVKWLIDVSKEMNSVLKGLVNRHIEDKLPVIIEGDFINPKFTKSFESPLVKSIFVQESDKNQIIQNYLSREGGDLQHYRAEISMVYGKWIAENCKENGIRVIESRPWDTALKRVIECLL